MTIDPRAKAERLFASQWDRHNLRTHLPTASASSIQEALGELGDWVRCARVAGLALELLAKAVILELAPDRLPTFSGPQGEAASAFLDGRGSDHPDVQRIWDIPTIDLRRSVNVAYDLLQRPRPAPEVLNRVVHPRNYATHMGQADGEVVEESVALTLAMANPLLPALGLDSDDWLGRDPGLREVAHALMNYSLGSQRHHGQAVAFAARWRAQREWASLCERLPAEVLAEVAIDPRLRPDLGEVVLGPCPSGGHFAWFELIFERSDDQPDDDDLEWLDVFRGSVDCPLCGVDLDYHGLAALGFGEPLETREVEI